MNSRRQGTLRLERCRIGVCGRNRLGGGAGAGAFEGEVSRENVARANVQLSAEQRAQIRKAIIEARNAWRVSSVDFDLAVGSVVPRGPVQVCACAGRIGADQT